MTIVRPRGIALVEWTTAFMLVTNLCEQELVIKLPMRLLYRYWAGQVVVSEFKGWFDEKSQLGAEKMALGNPTDQAARGLVTGSGAIFPSHAPQAQNLQHVPLRLV